MSKKGGPQVWKDRYGALVKEANGLGFKIKYVGEKDLQDYASMNPEAAKDMHCTMPEGEIWINSKWNKDWKNKADALKHEMEEMGLMESNGHKYFPAHKSLMEEPGW